MKLYRLTIQPQGGLGTPLKGDTLFGHFCWQAAHNPKLLQGGLDEQVKRYQQHPWVIFSSAFPQTEYLGGIHFALKRPDLPLETLFPSSGRSRGQQLRERKIKQQQRWMLLPADLNLDLKKMEYRDDHHLADMLHSQTEQEDIRRLMSKQARRWVIKPGGQHHNTINRRTGTTGLAPFTPYTQSIFYYYPGIKLALFILLDKEVTDIDKVFKALTTIGQWGYGKDASIGKGRFKVLEKEELPLPAAGNDANAAYTLSPAVPDPQSFDKAFFSPFIRFGRHGDEYARSKNPFKTPVIMADEGAVFVPQDREFFTKPYLGTGIKGISLSQPGAIMQGYAIYLPFRLERTHEGNN